MRQKTVITILILIASAALLSFPAAGQDEEYVDAPIEVNQPEALATTAGPPAANYSDQYNWGLINYGFLNTVYHQYSGDPIFSGGNSPSTFLNIGYLNIIPLDYTYLPGLGIGGDFMAFSSTSEDVYAGDAKTVTGPAIDMTFYTANLNLRLFFMDPFKDLLHPFFGASWGLIFGDFNTTKVGGDKFTTYFTGMAVSRSIGAQIKLGPRGGLITEFRTVTANNVKTNNDPFNQGSDDSVNLDFSGIIIALSGYYRF